MPRPPRPVLLQTGSTDNLSDPYGEFLAARAATPVYHLFGKKGIEGYSQPPTGKPIMNDLGYLGRNALRRAKWKTRLTQASFAEESVLSGAAYNLDLSYRENTDGVRLPC